jgi:anti-sigma B factor antagonist
VNGEGGATRSDFSIEVTQLAGPVYLVTVTGELDLSTVAPFRARLFDALARGGTKLILDLHGVTFIDSTNIGALLDAHRRVEQLEGEIAVVCTDTNVLKVFGIAGIDSLVRIHDSVESAAGEYAIEQVDADSELRTDALTTSGEEPSPRGKASDERIARNEALFREVNERIEEVHDDRGRGAGVEFLCECADPSCLEAIPLTLEEYEAIRERSDRFVVAEGHVTAGIERVVARHGGAEVVEKTGKAGRIAEELDSPRPDS